MDFSLVGEALMDDDEDDSVLYDGQSSLIQNGSLTSLVDLNGSANSLTSFGQVRKKLAILFTQKHQQLLQQLFAIQIALIGLLSDVLLI